jgi:hypothetical protein
MHNTLNVKLVHIQVVLSVDMELNETSRLESVAEFRQT